MKLTKTNVAIAIGGLALVGFWIWKKRQPVVGGYVTAPSGIGDPTWGGGVFS